MARLFYTDIKLNGNQLLDSRIENVGTLPGSGTLGQLVYSTTDDLVYVWEGTQWQALVYSSGGSFISIINAGSGISVTGTGNTRTVSHSNTSSVADSSNTGATVLQSITFDTFGHVQTIGTKTLTLSDLGYTGATNADNYGSWTISDGAGGTEAVTSGFTLAIQGAGGISSSYDPANNTLTINGAGVVGTTYSAGTGLSLTGTTFSVNILGIEDLSAPAGDRIAFYDDTSGAFEWLSVGTNLSISGTTLNSAAYTGGTGINVTGTTIALEGQALALHNFAGTGIMVRTGASSYAARTITAGTGVSVSNGSGAAGNPTITNTDRGSSQAIYKVINGDTGTDSADTNSDSLTLSGDTYISTAIVATSGATTVEFTLDISAVQTALGLATNYVTLAGAQTITGAKTFSAATTFDNNVTINGDLTISGNRVMTAPETVQVQDNLFVLNHGFTGTAADDSGFVVERGTNTNVAWIWDESADEWALISTTDDGTGTGNINVSGYEALRIEKLFMQTVAAATVDTDAFLVLDGNEVKTRTGTQLRSDIGAGTVTSVTIAAGAGIDVTGGPITTSGSITITAEVASTTNQGIVELATNTEARTGTGSQVITASNLSALNAKANIGDGNNTAFTVNHSLNSTDLIVRVLETSTGDIVEPQVTIPSASQVQVDFTGITPSTNQFRVLIMLLP